jgi:hypothetical protein
MKSISIVTKVKGLVVAALLAIWCFPAVSLAKPMPADPAPLPSAVTSTRAPVAAAAQTTESAEAASLAQREHQSQNLQDYKGGAAVVYVGSGVLLVVVIVLLILLI